MESCFDSDTVFKDALSPKNFLWLEKIYGCSYASVLCLLFKIKLKFSSLHSGFVFGIQELQCLFK